MSKGPATIRDVAKAAKVSAATVSRYLNKSIILPEETAGRIEKACKRLAYRPNALAKRLSLGTAQIIELVTPEIANPFFASLAAAAEAEATASGLFASHHEHGRRPRRRGREHRPPRLAGRRRPHRTDEPRRRWSHSPTASPDDRTSFCLTRMCPAPKCRGIFVENEQGAYEATRHLIESGHTAASPMSAGRRTCSAPASAMSDSFAQCRRRDCNRSNPGCDLAITTVARALPRRLELSVAGGTSDRYLHRQRLHRARRTAGLAQIGFGSARGPVDRQFRRHALRGAAASAADDRSSADRRRWVRLGVRTLLRASGGELGAGEVRLPTTACSARFRGAQQIADERQDGATVVARNRDFESA